MMFCCGRWYGGKEAGTHQRRRPESSAAMEILKERFARGEIDKEEFQEKRRIIEEE
jgi:putative membrane protein